MYTAHVNVRCDIRNMYVRFLLFEAVQMQFRRDVSMQNGR